MAPPNATGHGDRRFLRSETGIRLLSSLVLVTLALGSAFFGGVAVALFWLLAAAGAAIEWADVCKLERPLAMRVALLSGALAVSSLALLTPPALVTLGVGALSVCLVLLAARRGLDRVWGLAGLLVVGLLAGVPVLVRETPALGLTGLLWMFAVVWGTDIAAYFTGRALGGPKLAPRISPGKTWSGFFGGLAFGSVAGTLVALAGAAAGWTPPSSWIALVAMSALASVVGQAGDLAESALKRRFAVKDSSRLIPGHGGVLDRIDAFVAVCALMAVVVSLLPLAGSSGG